MNKPDEYVYFNDEWNSYTTEYTKEKLKEENDEQKRKYYGL